MNSPNVITLPAHMSAAGFSAVLAEAREACTQSVTVDAGALANVSTQTVQFLLALSAECTSAGHRFIVIDPSNLVESACQRLGLGRIGAKSLEH